MSGIISVAPARADELTADFTIDNGSPSASGGEVTFVLNAVGTISADLISTLAGAFLGFGFDSIQADLPESNFAPTTPDNPFGGDGDLYGNHLSGFLCSSCGTSETWTIGTPGEFTSVWQALGGGNATTDFYLRAQNDDQWDANASAVPELSTWAMLLAGFAALGFAAYRPRFAI
jgi:hypothetical protein